MWGKDDKFWVIYALQNTFIKTNRLFVNLRCRFGIFIFAL